MRLAFLLSAFSFLAACAHVDVDGGWHSSSTTGRFRATGGAAVVLGVAAAIADPYQPDRAPELDPNRQINEQDCTKPVDLAAGNLRCR